MLKMLKQLSNPRALRVLAAIVFVSSVVQFGVGGAIFNSVWDSAFVDYDSGSSYDDYGIVAADVAHITIPPASGFVNNAVLAGVVACMASIVVMVRADTSLNIVAVAAALELYAFSWACKYLDMFRPDLWLSMPGKYKALVSFSFITVFFTWLLFVPIILTAAKANKPDSQPVKNDTAAPAGATTV